AAAAGRLESSAFRDGAAAPAHPPHDPGRLLRMLRLIDLRTDRSDPAGRLPRATAEQVADVRRTVAEVLAAVRDEGDAAVIRFTKAFDGYDADAGGLEVSPDEVDAAVAGLDADLR